MVKNTKFNTLKTKVNNLEKRISDAATLIHLNQHNTDIQKIQRETIGDVDKKIPNTFGLVTTTVLITKNSEVENKIPDNSSLVTTTVLNTKISKVQNKLFDHDKYITTPEFNKLTAENFAARLKQSNLVNKTDFDNRLINFDRTITSNKTKYLEVNKN